MSHFQEKTRFVKRRQPTFGERFPTYRFVVCGSPSSNDPGSFPLGSKSSGSSSKRLICRGGIGCLCICMSDYTADQLMFLMT